MIYSPLGKSSLNVSRISFGCMSLGERDSDNARLLHSALDNGINFFDTADLYQHGRNESTVGKAFKGMRNRVILATKVGNQWREDGSGWDWNPRRNYILKAVESSLRHLQTDYIDLYQLHGGTMEDPIEEAIDAFELLKEQGKIRHYGISSIRPNVIRTYIEKSAIASVMMQYSLLDRRPEESCLEILQREKVAVLARGTLASGLLTGKPRRDYLDHSEKAVQKAAQAIAAVAGRTPAQTALQFVLSNPVISTAVAGIRSAEQLLDCLGVFSAPSLSAAELRLLQDSISANRYTQHR